MSPAFAVSTVPLPLRRSRAALCVRTRFVRAVGCATRAQAQQGSNPTLANLHELTERIADLLHVGSIQKNHMHCPKDAPLGYLNATTHVAILFGKHLIRDQVTVEYAKRIVTLVKQIATGSFLPNVICFTGGNGLRGDGFVSEAAAGYSLFRSVCDEAGVDVSRFDFILETNSRNTKENIANVITELRRRSGSDAISTCHFTLISSDYHLIRIQEVHRLSPRQSVLFPLEVSSATWNCIFAAYPFCVSRDATTAFLGRTVVLANDLSIVLVNLNGVIEHRQFLARENLARLNETFAKMREMYRIIDSTESHVPLTTGGFRKDMRRHAESLELAIHQVREAQTILSPLSGAEYSVSRTDLELAQRLLLSTIVNLRSSMDPDRVLRALDRVAIIDDMAAYISKRHQLQKQQAHEGNTKMDPHKPFEGLKQRDVSLFDEDWCRDSRAKTLNTQVRPIRARSSTASEATGRGEVVFKGNGKRITRDGPNLVVINDDITASSYRKQSPASPTPPPPAIETPPPAPAKRTRARRSSTAASTPTNSSAASSKTRTPSSSHRKRKSATASTAASSSNGGATSDPKSAATRSPVKRKTTTAKRTVRARQPPLGEAV